MISEKISGIIVVTKEGESRHPDLQDAIGKLNFAKAKILGFISTNGSVKNHKYEKYGKYGKYKGYEVCE